MIMGVDIMGNMFVICVGEDLEVLLVYVGLYLDI